MTVTSSLFVLKFKPPAGKDWQQFYSSLHQAAALSNDSNIFILIVGQDLVLSWGSGGECLNKAGLNAFFQRSFSILVLAMKEGESILYQLVLAPCMAMGGLWNKENPSVGK